MGFWSRSMGNVSSWLVYFLCEFKRKNNKENKKRFFNQLCFRSCLVRHPGNVFRFESMMQLRPLTQKNSGWEAKSFCGDDEQNWRRSKEREHLGLRLEVSIASIDTDPHYRLPEAFKTCFIIPAHQWFSRNHGCAPAFQWTSIFRVN